MSHSLDITRCRSLDARISTDDDRTVADVVPADRPLPHVRPSFDEAVAGYSPEEQEFIRRIAVTSAFIGTVRHFRAFVAPLDGLKAAKVLRKILKRVEADHGPAVIDPADFIRTSLSILCSVPDGEIEDLVAACLALARESAAEPLRAITKDLRGTPGGEALRVALGLSQGTTAAKRAGVSKAAISKAASKIDQRLARRG